MVNETMEVGATPYLDQFLPARQEDEGAYVTVQGNRVDVLEHRTFSATSVRSWFKGLRSGSVVLRKKGRRGEMNEFGANLTCRRRVGKLGQNQRPGHSYPDYDTILCRLSETPAQCKKESCQNE